jgi:hypothetical protein
MTAARAYVTAVVAGAMTAGIGAANAVAVPEKAVGTDVDWAASITIKILDFDTPGAAIAPLQSHSFLGEDFRTLLFAAQRPS